MKTVNVIEAVFFAALDKNDAQERAQYLDQACNGDPDLRRCVEKLLAAQPRVGEFLQAPAPGLPAAAAPETVDHATDERPGTILGPYKLLHEIGEGGMGTVWMAEQAEPVKRRVALKVIKPGMDSRQVLARFEAERQALALMDHPNIAKVLDAGATDAGRPYFVMELVKGQPITEFCDKNRLTTQERLGLFVSVCNAIQHAHQKGVIHRDIKPSNVLVALYDGKPVPKVIDFGVVKAIGDPLTDKTLFTRHGQVIGTFEYMSPEQATLDQLDIDTRSDVYSLGVLLYELLTGTTPLDKDELRKGGLAEVLRRIREVEPPKPSTRLTSSPGLLATAAAQRKSDVQKLPRAVRGELDWIVMKALDKDRNRRFATANGLAMDVERYLNDEPVHACPPTLAYRFKKYARKHKVALATGSAIAAALLIGIALTSWQAVRATHAEHDTAAALDKAADERDAAIQLGEKLDARLIEIKAANDKIHRDQAQQRVDQYAWDMQLLPLTWDAGSVAEAQRMLERQDSDLRGFEWRYWTRKMHTELASVRLPGLPESRTMRGGPNNTPPGSGSWILSGNGTRLAYFAAADGRASLSTVKTTVLVWDLSSRKRLLSHLVVETPEEAGAFSTISGSISLSHDGKRVSVAATSTFLVTDPETGIARFNGEPNKNMVRVIDVDSGDVRFDSGKTGGDELRTKPRAQLSPDGRKLLIYTAPPLMPGEDRPRGYGRIAVWHLDAVGQKPVIIDSANFDSLSPDGSRVIGFTQIGEGNRRVRTIWDTVSGKELLSFPGSIMVPSPRWTYLADVVIEDKDKGDGEASKVRTLKVFDGTTGKEISSTPLPAALSGQGVRGVAWGSLPPPIFSPDESLVAVAHRSTPGTQRIDWYFVEPKTGQIRHTLEDPGAAARDFGLSRSGTRLFSGDGSQFLRVVDNAIHTFNIASGRPVQTMRGHINPIVAAAPAPKPEDQVLRTIEADGTLKEWDLHPPPVPPKIAVVEQPASDSGGLSFAMRGSYRVSPGGELVAFAAPGQVGKPDTVHVWDVTGKGPTILEARPRKDSDPNSTIVATPFLSSDGKRVALYRANRSGGGFTPKKSDPKSTPPISDVTVWDLATKKELFHTEFSFRDRFGFAGGLRDFSADGATIVMTRTETDRSPSVPRAAGNRARTTLWTIDVATGREGPSITVDGSMLPLGSSLGGFSPDARRFAGAIQVPTADDVWTTQFAVWDLVRGTQVFSIPLKSIAPDDSQEFEGSPARGAAIWSPDGSRLAIVNTAGPSIALVDAATGKLIRTLNPSTRGTVAMQPRIGYSPDGRRIALAIRQRLGAAISVLDTDSGKEVLSLPVTPQATGGFGFFSQDTAANRVMGASLTFSPDGHRLLTFARATNGGLEGPQETYLRVRTWDARPLPEAKGP